MKSLFIPRTVAVVGASSKEKSVGYEVVANLLRSGFRGPVYPINPRANSVHSVPAYPTLESVPGEVDLAILTVPRDKVLSVVDQAIAKGVKALVVITAGFKEVDETGAKLEEELGERVRAAGIRMVGPNCMGLINTDPEVRLNASFTASDPPRGGVAVASQSGALGETILKTAAHLGLGLSSFVSLGNKTDVTGNDLLEYWADDPSTNLVLLYLESFGDPKRFAKAARYMTRSCGKPVLAVKSGRSKAGARAASSHTGSLAGADVAVDSLLHQCGVIRVDTVAELFTLAQGFANQPIPKGSKVGILTNAGGPGIMATDAAAHFGLELATLKSDTVEAMLKVLPPEASLRNPIDTIATAGAAQYQTCATSMYCDESVDGLVIIFVSPVMIDAKDIAHAIVAGIEEGKRLLGEDKPVLTCFMGKHHGDEGIGILHKAGIPVFAFPEAAIESLAAMARFGAIQKEPLGEIPSFNPSPDRSAASKLLEGGSGWLRFPLVMELLSLYGIPVAPWAIVSSVQEAVAFAEEKGYPIVLKIDSDTLLHKTEHDAVRLDLRSSEDIEKAYSDISANIENIAGNHSFVVQSMLRGDAEILVGATTDPAFGHLIAFGLGGIFAEIMKDVAFRIHPLTDRDAKTMIESIRGFPLLQGARGRQSVDLDGLSDVLLRMSQLISDFPEIAELDINPFLANSDVTKQAAVDARIRLVGQED